MFDKVQSLGMIKIELSKGDVKKKPNHNSKVLGLMKNKMMVCADKKFEAKQQRLSSALRVDRLPKKALKSEVESEPDKKKLPD